MKKMLQGLNLLFCSGSKEDDVAFIMYITCMAFFGLGTLVITASKTVLVVTCSLVLTLTVVVIVLAIIEAERGEKNGKKKTLRGNE